MQESVCQEEVYNSLYRKHFTGLRNYVYYKCGDLDQAEDIAQESFIRLWQKCADVLFEKVTGFVHTVANRLFLDQVRSKKVSLKFEKDQITQQNNEDPYHILRTEEFRQRIEEVISDLPEGQREVFLLNRIEKHTYKEIAEMLGVSQTAVEKRMAKALVKLKDRIEEFKNI
ncbi:RNA polymerase subunit sigma-70 [Roseivirga sp. 4D4]|uniref:RNA polymerase sigma factor n=1 Tax=Roseivirga sp. 4D4 TaxID=1889784 RepID=UPI0008534A25|nr:RNA polymerase sigma factor [Roseivirga sp. 4D4]OEK01186.1 RNA polymerase subunit sigma-70 [Roseivirga sp. 4D4]